MIQTSDCYDEYKEMMDDAKELQLKYEKKLPTDFWDNVSALQGSTDTRTIWRWNDVSRGSSYPTNG